MKKYILFIAAAFFMFSCTDSRTFKLPDVVKTEGGRITGVPRRDPSIMVFKGIPYAAPAVDDLRWRPPQPAE